MDTHKADLVADYVNAKRGCEEIVKALYSNVGFHVGIIYDDNKVLPLSETQTSNIVNGLSRIIESYNKSISEIE